MGRAACLDGPIIILFVIVVVFQYLPLTAKTTQLYVF